MNNDNKTDAAVQSTGLAGATGSDFYVVVNDYNTGDLARKVNARITAGFKPLGGIGCTSDRDGLGNDHRQFYQAMIFCPNVEISHARERKE